MGIPHHLSDAFADYLPHSLPHCIPYLQPHAVSNSSVSSRLSPKPDCCLPSKTLHRPTVIFAIANDEQVSKMWRADQETSHTRHTLSLRPERTRFLQKAQVLHV